MRIDLKDCHPNCIDIRVFRGELFLERASEVKHIGVQQLRCHPPNRALLSADSVSGPACRFIDNRGKPKVPQACMALGIYQDVDLALSFSGAINRTVNEGSPP